MNIPAQSQHDLTIPTLPTLIHLLCERANYALVPNAEYTPDLFVRYLRRKPGRGLAIIYAVEDVQQPIPAATAPTTEAYHSVSLTLDEQALHGSRICFSSAQAQQTPLELQSTGILYAPELGLSLQTFPADARLTMLEASCDTSPRTPLLRALEAAARLVLENPIWQLQSARAIPVRYKPANRCVIRYILTLQNPDTSVQKTLNIYGKVYADATQACTIHALMQDLYAEQQVAHQLPPFLPRPLGISNELGLTLTEAVMPSSSQENLKTGIQAFQPQIQKNSSGTVTSVILPSEALHRTAQALAHLHNSSVQPNESTPRNGAKEAKRVRERAALIAAHNPAQAHQVQSLAHELATRLETLEPDSYRPAHGGFKASQLLFSSSEVFVVDFDGFCLADSALDVGYFLAYLRPSGMWYQRPGMRQWFNEASKEFLQAYQQAMLQSLPQPIVTGIVERARLYEAALLFKIATRRVNRLNSPRPAELFSMLREIAQCLS